MFMRVLYQVEGGESRSFLNFFWVPRVSCPALRAEEEVGNRNHESFDTYGIAFMAGCEVIVFGGCFGKHRLVLVCVGVGVAIRA